MDQFSPQQNPQKPSSSRSSWRIFLIVVFVLTAFFLTFSDQFFAEQVQPEEISFSELQNWYRENKLQTVDIKDDTVTVAKKEEEKQYFAVIPPSLSLRELGFDDESVNKATEVKYISTKSSEFWAEIASRLLPFVLIILVFFFMMRAFSKGANGAFSFGKSRDKLFQKGKKKTLFANVAGCEESKLELSEVVEFLKSPKKFTKMGAKIPKGVLLIGPPGTGKTLLARAVAGEADVPFFSISGSEFVEMFVGVGASRVRDLFAKAKKNSPSIVFIDEIDAVGKQRGQGMGGGHDEREQTLNQILTEMDGFDNETNVIVMAATNRPDILDKALLRPGRFDRRVTIDLPQMKARKEILAVHAIGKPLDANADLEEIARVTPGFSGADLENLLNEAAILAARENQKTITKEHLHKSHEKVILGPEKRSLIMNEKERKNTAYHEAGHAVITYVMPEADPVRKVTIIPRGRALGVTYNAPDEESFTQYTKKYFTEMCIFMGGRAAEKYIFGDVSSGAANDIHHATIIARNMVMRFGMSLLGPMEFAQTEFGMFDMGDMNKAYSEEFAAKVDEEVQKLLQRAMEKAEEILKEHSHELHLVAEALLKKETLNQKEFEAFFKKKMPKKNSKTPKKISQQNGKTKEVSPESKPKI
ncbi:ATP-dependent metallopeptidase FtsH/Yme1/Tma family protein [Candidatus Peregrinibacteria bacterium]|nr:ATP-dependent metallopeptidase FtsH/Yme1/Tma family protein [Candidatus Peregrinibacteria bacterium]